MTGTFLAHNKGFGFVEVEGLQEDLFIPEEYVGGAFHKDTVQVALCDPRKQSGQRREAKVVRILQRGITSLVGTFEKRKKHYGFVIPDNTKIPCDIFVEEGNAKGAVDGHKVVVEITSYGKSPEGKIVEILGHVYDPGVDILSIVKGYELPMQFPERVRLQAQHVAKPVSEEAMQGRRDLRTMQMVTIDGEDTKDLDDAVSLTYDGTSYQLGVHIADVSHYVREFSSLDREALKRGTSVYLVDRVIPMLPHTLSNGICSLNAGEDRLALSCLMRIDARGEVTDYEICESVIRVDRRMCYSEVKQLLEDADAGVDTCAQIPRELLQMLCQMRGLAAILHEKRRRRGAIDFDFPECKIRLDRAGHPIEIKAYERNVATGLIEEFMLAANETVAQHFYWLDIPFLYRVHDVPDPEKLQSLALFIHNFGYYMKTTDKRGSKAGSGEVHPKEIQKLLAKVEGTPEEAMIARLALRSMKQAKYSVVSSGHFGLACSYYCHFTSPIRRYPDLQIHRIIKEQLHGRLSNERIAHFREILPNVAQESSRLERRADEAERETDKLKKVEYMEQFIGKTFDGVISGVTAWGVYVALPNTVEGMVHVSRLPGEYFYYQERTGELVGEMSGKRYQLGMPVSVRVIACDRFTRTIDFEITER